MHFKTSFTQEKTNFGHLKQRQNCRSFVLFFSCVTHLKIQIKSLFKKLPGSKNRIKRNSSIFIYKKRDQLEIFLCFYSLHFSHFSQASLLTSQILNQHLFKIRSLKKHFAQKSSQSR